MICYAVKDWHHLYETHDTRRYKNLRWVPMMNGQEGNGYKRIVAHEKSVEIFCAWTLILQLASKSRVRGLLIDCETPLDSEDMHFKTGFPKSIFDIALEVLCYPKINWLEELNYDDIPSKYKGLKKGYLIYGL